MTEHLKPPMPGLHCATCRRSLTGFAHADSCPDCGTPVQTSIEALQVTEKQRRASKWLFAAFGVYVLANIVLASLAKGVESDPILPLVLFGDPGQGLVPAGVGVQPRAAVLRLPVGFGAEDGKSVPYA